MRATGFSVTVLPSINKVDYDYDYHHHLKVLEVHQMKIEVALKGSLLASHSRSLALICARLLQL